PGDARRIVDPRDARRRHARLLGAGHDRQRPRSAAAGRLESKRGAVAPGVSLQPDAVLGREADRRARRHQGRAQQSRRRRLDRSEQGALRTARHARARQHRPHRVARLRAHDELGRGACCGARQARHARAVPVTRAARRRAPRAWPLAAIIVSFFAGVFIDGHLRTDGPPQPAEPLVETRPSTGSGRAEDTRVVSPSNHEHTGPTMSAALISPPPPATAPAPSARVLAPVATAGDARARLRVPIDGSSVETWKGGFDERRGGGARGHEAVDILSPRNTPVHAVENGTIARIFESKAGGHTVYQFNPDGTRVYYYAHLERYANGLHEGQPILQGEVLGYVGTSGNAPPNTPHLHFAIFQLGADKRWWQGTAIDPY